MDASVAASGGVSLVRAAALLPSHPSMAQSVEAASAALRADLGTLGDALHVRHRVPPQLCAGVAVVSHS